jgi:hypothetical protein
MAVTRTDRAARIVLLLCGCCLFAPAVQAQETSITKEVDVTAGGSTDATQAGAAQFRVFGQITPSWRVMAELAWGRVSRTGSDAFGAAYPYDNRVRPIETYVERLTHSGPTIVGLRLGRYRTPFGMSAASDHAYSGFTRAPLIRYGGNFALSNTFLETGAALLIGAPALQIETSVGAPADAAAAGRPRTLDLAMRAQGYYRSFVVGASYLSTSPTPAGDFVVGRTMFRGVDARWMRSGVQLRGEWITGRPFDGVATRGGYLDLFVHHVGMGPVTAVGRLERIVYDAGPFSRDEDRVTVGAKVRLIRALGLQANVSRDRCRPANTRRTALDVSLTESLRFP